MKRLLVVMFFAASAFAQKPPPGLPAACGPENVGFKVKLDKSQPALVQSAAAGKARVYFIGEDFNLVIRIGLDGRWVGANENDSYFSVSVEPGEHHLCASADFIGGQPMRLLHLTAQAGSVYYISAREVYTRDGVYLFFGAEDSDQAAYEIATFPLSVSTPKTPKK
ncbi:MAG: hypothetical protein ABSC88_00255 [Terracidiphilus sp.]|jgi:hypothetical protein